MPGPFQQYIEPGVYTRTLADSTLATLTGGLRIPLFIGVGSETLQITDYEIIRGSSAVADNFMSNEDVSYQFSGTNREIIVSKFPIVTGTGQGVINFDPKNVTVTVNNQPMGVSAVFGDIGKIVLSGIPRFEDVVKVSYYFKRTDTKIENENLSVQVNGSNKEFKTNFVPIVDGTNGGIATTDVTKVVVKVNDVAVDVAEVNGQAGLIILKNAPIPDSFGNTIVKVSYWTNTWQDTFDYLPVSNITEVVRVGTAPGRSDFTNTLDFIIEDNKIQWGNSFSVKPTYIYPNSTAFNTQINDYLIDNRVYMQVASGTSNGTNKLFNLSFVPVDGSGRGYVTDDVSKIIVYVGINVEAAYVAGPVLVEKMSGAERKVYLKNAPTLGQNVYVTYYYNIISDDSFEFKCTLPSTPSTSGLYTVRSYNQGDLFVIEEDKPSHAVADINFSTEGITWPAGGFDGQTISGYAVQEVILVNFIGPTGEITKDFMVLSDRGSEGSNGFGSLNQTYIDAKTGVRFTIMEGTLVTYQSGDILEFDVIKNFTTGVLPQYSIPGIKTTISNLNDVAVNNLALVTTYNKSGLEPNVGDYYYVTLNYAKTEYPIKIYTKLKDIVSEIGAVNTDNRLSLAAYLALSNGAIAVALSQVLRDPSGVDASSADYIAALGQVESPIKDTGIKPAIICPVTTKQDVINEMRIHCEKMSTIRYKSERTGVYGYAVGTTPEQAQQFAKNMKSERLVGIYPDGAIIGLIDELGNVNEAVVDGSMLAAAFSGLAVNPIYDVATPLTHKTLTGFRRLVRYIDSVTMNQTAISGLTILEDLVPNLLIRQAMTTDPSTVLTREPTVIYIKDYVQQQIRANLDNFIGIKFLPTVIQDVETTIDGMMNQLINNQIITAFTGTSATQDQNDPTILNVETYYSPVFPLNWIVVTLNLRVSI